MQDAQPAPQRPLWDTVPSELSESQRHHLLSSFKICTSPRRGTLMQLVRDLPAEDVELLVTSLTAVFTPDPSPWDDLYFEELERLFAQAEHALDPRPYLRDTKAFAWLGHTADGPLQKRIRCLLTDKLRSPDPQIRHQALTLLRHYLCRHDDELTEAISSRRYDPVWKVRIEAFELFNAIRGMSRYDGMPYLDQLVLRVKEWFDEL